MNFRSFQISPTESIVVCSAIGIMFSAAIFQTVIGVLYYLCLLSVVLIMLSRNRFSLGIGSAILASGYLICIGWLSLQDANVLRDFIIGDSDSFVYHIVGSEISNTVPLVDQLKVWDLEYLDAIQFSLGSVFKDMGFFWFLGFFYTIVGDQNGPFLLVLLNLLAVTAAVVMALECIVIDRSERTLNFLVPVSFVLGLLFFSNSIVLSGIFSCRKDIFLIAIFVLALFFISKRKKVRAVLAILGISFVRAGFIVPLVVQYLAMLNSVRRRINSKDILFVGFMLLIFMPILYPILFESSLLDIQVTDLVGESLTTNAVGSAVFINNWWLNWFYVLVTPIPSANVNLYVRDAQAWLGLTSFISNGLFLYLFVRTIQTSDHGQDSEKLLFAYISVVIVLYLAFSSVAVTGVYTGYIGLIDPRYKIAIWVLQLALGIRLASKSIRNTAGNAPFPEIMK